MTVAVAGFRRLRCHSSNRGRVYGVLPPPPQLELSGAPSDRGSAAHAALSHAVCNSVVTALITPEVCELSPNLRQGDPPQLISRSPESRPPHIWPPRLNSTPSHAKQWEPTGSQAATQTDNNGPAVMSQRQSIGLSFSVVSVDGATAATPGGALSTWAPLPRPGNDRFRSTGGKGDRPWFWLRCICHLLDLGVPDLARPN